MTRKRDIEPRDCEACHASFTPKRDDAKTCSPTCRKRLERGTHVVTDEDRAAIRRVLERDGCGHPLARPPTAEEVRAHILATAKINPGT